MLTKKSANSRAISSRLGSERALVSVKIPSTSSDSPIIWSRLGSKLVLEHSAPVIFTGFAAGAFTHNPFISSGSFSPDRTGPSRWRGSSRRDRRERPERSTKQGSNPAPATNFQYLRRRSLRSVTQRLIGKKPRLSSPALDAIGTVVQ